ncbi:unnamed protein product [Rotaria magnacalcarata]|uniref:Uncharacterized protein n=3 Tax=Rotaria magnacalcarata TaxID=392030 RepID=A0A819ENI0_9BILA|nr:unnamed protein product [Rotaria magnacalcarata]CAF3855012.1 unnamed protein product [Rotaria magnacalcarata]
MAATYQNLPRSLGRPPVQKSRTKKTTTHQLNSKTTNNSNAIKIRFGNNSLRNSIYKPASILKKAPHLRQPLYSESFNENMFNWHQPTDLEPMRARRLYSPIRTPPRLRTLITPPGIEPYRNRYNLRRFTSPLPTVDNLYSPSTGLGTWGLNSADYNLTSNANLIRRYPSPLSQYGLGSGLTKQKKSYIVVPHLNKLLSPPVSNSIGGSYLIPPRRIAPFYYPNSHYAYRDGVNTLSSQRFHREPYDYLFVRHNEAFANRYIDDFIGRNIEDKLIPDILLEAITELDAEQKQHDKFYRSDIHRYNAELTSRMNREELDENLLSDQWVREFDYQRGFVPRSNFDSNISSLRPLNAKQDTYVRTTNQLRYHDLPTNLQGDLFANMNQELIDYDNKDMFRELDNQEYSHQSHQVFTVTDNYDDMYDTSQRPIDDVQYHAIENHAQSKLLDPILLDQLIKKCIKQKGSSVDMDDASRLLDGTILHNLIDQYQDIDESRSRTLDNYSSTKFHLNSFMNVTMDSLLLELSNSLIEDMKDLDEQEQRTLR